MTQTSNIYAPLEACAADFNDLQKTLADPAGGPRLAAIREALEATAKNVGVIDRRYSFKTLAPRSSVRVQRSRRAWLQGNRLKTRDADWNGFVRTNWSHFLFALRIAAMARWY